MSRKEIEHAEKAERDRAEKVRKEKDKDDKKLQDRVEKDRKDKDKSDRKIELSERARKFENVLGEAAEGCCESCNYQAKTASGEYQPCKIGHKDSGPDKELCADSSDPRYRPKK